MTVSTTGHVAHAVRPRSFAIPIQITGEPMMRGAMMTLSASVNMVGKGMMPDIQLRSLPSSAYAGVSRDRDGAQHFTIG